MEISLAGKKFSFATNRQGLSEFRAGGNGLVGIKGDRLSELFTDWYSGRIATALAEADISLFALSTYDTDYVLVKSKPLSQACMALNSAGYILENG